VKEIRRFRADEVRVEPFVPHSFNQNEEFLSSMALPEILRSKSSKGVIRKMAKREGLSSDEEKIRFARKIINLIADEISNGK
jgi:hypothetical protein